MHASLPERPGALERALEAEARRLGFTAFGIADPEGLPALGEALAAFLAAGHAGDMAWLARTPERRARPRLLWPDVRSIVMLGLSYAPAGDPLVDLARPAQATISVYAKGRDYHDVMKPRLKALARWLSAAAGGEARVFVDTAAVMEKPWAAAAGLGWQGKHTNLVSRQEGSWLFLGALFTSLALARSTPHADRCGRCRRCLDICPTDAFTAPYRLDARRCISYLTIEHKGPIPAALRPLMGNRIYGCDDCLAVCPWNKFAAASREMAFAPRDALDGARLAHLAGLDEAGFRTLFSGSPIKRIGRARFLRNVAIALGNAGGASDPGALKALARDASALVRGAAVWALGRVSPGEIEALAQALLPGEEDPEVQAEWRLARQGAWQAEARAAPE